MNEKQQRGVRRLDELLSEHMAQRGYGQSFLADEISDTWAELVGPALTQFTTPGKLSRGVLDIFVANSTVMQELKFRESELMAGIKEQLPQYTIARLRFKIS